jgi:biopolymer transport protein ExbD
MTFSVRHEGSPRAVSGLTAAEIIAGLEVGRWEPTDEVRGDGEADWQPLGDHSQFAATAADVAPLPKKEHPDETRLDMNPLIDVALVLLIFFILTTTYETVRKVLDMPGASSQANTSARVVDLKQIKESTIIVEATQKNGNPIIKIEKTPVGLEDLDNELRRRVRDSKKVQMLIDAAPEVEYGIVVAIMDAARGAGIKKTLMAAAK